MQGFVKTYDNGTQTGVIVLDPGPGEVYLRPGSLEGSMFRFLRQGQKITFETVEDDEQSFATDVRIGHDGY
ncbi:MAG: cold shock domain-containing protein [Acidimicrobiia bacterium]|nr:cold shock domain-containing protein [Acidimicrobiia bacterium]